MIRARGLAVRRQGRAVLGPLDLDVAPGELLLLLGPSGCGKSTLLRALGGTLDPDAAAEGDLDVAGLDPRTARPADLAARVGQGFQHPEEQLLALDVLGEVAFKLENLRMPAGEGLPRVRAAMEAWGLGALGDRESATLSGGEARRTALAAALVTEPPVLLLDEPTTGLDRASLRFLLDRLRDLKGRVTVVVSEHRADVLQPLADRVLRLGGATGTGTRPRRSPPPHGVPLVRVDGLHAGPLRGITFERGAGVHGIAGPNGAGKTTLLRALAGFAKPRAGRCRVEGAVGYAPQAASDAFAAGSVREELALGGAHPDALAARFHLTHLLDRHPFTLSGGERQRLALACAVAHDPQVLLLDEPTTGLDTAGHDVLEALFASDPARCILIATHDEDVLARCDTVVHVEDGRLREVSVA